MSYVRLQAHQGVESECPGNTMSSFRAAVEQGYEMIELDLGVTKDGRFITMHNETINYAARNPDGSRIEPEIPISSITYEQALQYDFGLRFSEKFRGEKLPLFDDVLALAREHNVTLKIDNKIQRFTDGQLTALYALIRASGAQVMISCWSLESAERARRELPDAWISFDGITDEDFLQKAAQIAGEGRLFVWMPIDKSRAYWVPEDWFPTPETCAIIKKYAHFCIWALEGPESFRRACALYAPFAAETSGEIKPYMARDGGACR